MSTLKPLRLLLIESSSDDEIRLLNAIAEAGYAVRHQRVTNERELREILYAGYFWDVIVSDYELPELEGLRALQLVRQQYRDTPFLFVSGTLMDDVGLRAMRSGANDYLMKDNLARLGPALERELKESANRRQTLVTKVQYRAILDSTLDAILVVQETGYVQIFNKGAETAFGYNASEILGQHIGVLLPGDAFHRLKLIPAKLAPEPAGTRVYESHYIVLRGTHKDGRTLPLEASCSRARCNEEKIYTIMLRDISQRLASERALRESEERLRLLMDNIRDYAIIMLDTQGRVTTWNQGAANLMGYEADEIIGQPASLFYPNEDTADGRPRDRLEQAIAEGRSCDEGWRVRRDGSRFYAEVTLSAARDAGGSLCGVVKITRDITERRAMEDELRRHRDALEARVAERTAELELARQQAERLARSKSDFLANMSHEIRTPMNAVLGLAYMLEQQNLPEDAQDLARKIQKSGQTLLGIINDILDFSRIESGGVEIEQAPFRLCDVLDNLATIMTATAADKPLELIITPPDCIDMILRGDALRLEQVLINLTSNAIKFTASGMVEVRIQILEQTQTRVGLRFSVIDTGIGIDMASQERLFRPFSQADPSTTRRFGGSGLGLAICRRLVNLMGGRIGVRSEPDQGSTFWFELELDLMERRDDPWRDHGMRMKVLVADAKALVREALATTVTALGWTGRQVDSGERALQMVLQDTDLQGPNALVLLDWRMPDMDGLAVASAIRQALPRSRQPLLFISSAHRRERILAMPGADSADAVLARPIAPSPLYDAVIRARSRRLGVRSPERPSPQTAEGQLSGLRLLVVDDSDINREVARRIFADAGAQVFMAENGREAVEWLVAHPNAVDLVLMDVQMPVMDGHDATRLIRRTQAISDLPIIALTAGALNNQETAALEAGMDAFLPKPFDVSKTIALIRHLTGNDRARPDRDAMAASGIEMDGTQKGTKTGEAQHEQGRDLPGLAVGKGLRLWRDPTVYRRYLRQFAQDYRNAPAHLAKLEREEARRYLHKLKGGAHQLALPRVADCAERLERTLSGSAGSADYRALKDALETAMTSIGAYAADASDPAGPETPGTGSAWEDPDPGRTAQLLRDALAAFEDFDIISSEPILDTLSERLPAGLLAPVRQAVQSFDSTAGIAAIGELAERMNISIEEP
ncbi:response regulator [Imhoffiella purpurea]|uniref:histidine kinase n=1 Tax=Imhoffiella purpurea TaxID=1249627 RepID=W9VB96_9GAMM|nr:response regulator [Imhoffiella purpurea]EXJ16719.1 hypothetical protein D779_3396 [Imhoffiella purpurea]